MAHASHHGIIGISRRRGLGGLVMVVAAALGGRIRSAAAADIEITNCRARATPEGAAEAVAYLTIVNHGVETDRLLAVSSPLADAVRIDKPVWHGLAMHMETLTEVEIPPFRPVAFRPGHRQLTLLRPTRALRPDSTVPLELKFARAGRMEVVAKVVNKLLG